MERSKLSCGGKILNPYESPTASTNSCSKRPSGGIRTVIWAQTLWLIYAAVVVRLERAGILDFWTVNADGLNDYTATGHVVLGFAAVSFLCAFYVFPPLVVILLIRHYSPRPIALCVLAELALGFGNVYTMQAW
ncbi:hypothetical protein [Fuerstiella marisgermanici]|uniref:Uncharacterized protein n=1 Tax=Fuerstiella marisgermanici TaxID=1891926 RepID=A0A1P8WKH4_9PLAN|nr:hypothetical protein [Fuerstiella marisgermanici]APZ94562.1 hypothetical protein Fuma_04194 [Fuerstiella marisgermanici]